MTMMSTHKVRANCNFVFLNITNFGMSIKKQLPRIEYEFITHLVFLSVSDAPAEMGEAAELLLLRKVKDCICSAAVMAAVCGI